MITRNTRIWLAIAALLLGVAAAVVRTPAPKKTAAAAITRLRPVDGC
jgi:hypothetical protein